MAIRGFIGILALAGLVFLSVSAPVRADTPLLFVPVAYVNEDEERAYRVLIINPSSQEIEHTIDLDAEPDYTAVDTAGNRVFVSQEHADRVLVFQPETGALLDTLELPGVEPRIIRIDADVGELYINSDNAPEVHVYSLDTLEPVRTLDLGDLRAWYMDLHPDAGMLIAFVSEPGFSALRLFDMQTGALIDEHTDAGSIRIIGGLDLQTDHIITGSLGAVRSWRITPEGLVNEFFSYFPLTLEDIVVDTDGRRLYMARNSVDVYAVDLDEFYATQPEFIIDMPHQHAEVHSGGPMALDRANGHLYVTNETYLFPPVPPLSENPAPTGWDNTTIVTRLALDSLQVQYEIIPGYRTTALTTGPILAGEALPNPPAIPTLHPAGIGVLILVMMGITARRYRLRAHPRTGPRP